MEVIIQHGPGLDISIISATAAEGVSPKIGSLTSHSLYAN